MNETERILIRGISQQLIRTIGIINKPIIINNKELNVDFHFVETRFPIMKHRILGHTFLRDYKAMIDIVNNTQLIAAQSNYNEIIKIDIS